MENARNQESRNRNDGRETAGADVEGSGSINGGGVRSNDGNESTIDAGSTIGKIGTPKSIGYDGRDVSGNASVEITDGYYFTPNGSIERIPSGHYIGSDGRLRKRRKQRSATGNSDGNAHRNRSETGEHEAESFPENLFLGDKPLNVRGGKRKAKTVKAETSKLTMVTMLASGAAAIFTSISLLTKHEHWKLHPEEGNILAEALNEAISTLPEKYYAQVTGIIEKWIPWINLTFVVGAIIVPRIEASSKRIEKTYNEESKGSNAGTGQSSSDANPFNSYTSLGFNDR